MKTKLTRYFACGCLAVSFLLCFDSQNTVCGQRGLGIGAAQKLQQAIATVERGSPAEAIAAMRAALDQFKTNPTAWYYYGFALVRAGDYETARDAFKQALKHDSEFFLARLRLAHTLLLLNQPEEAEKEALRALGADAKRGGTHYTLGVVYLSNGDSKKALEEANLTLQTNGSFAPAFLLRNEALLLSIRTGGYGRPEKRNLLGPIFKDALESLEKYAALTPRASMSNFVAEQLEALRFYVQAAEQEKSNGDRLFWYPDEVSVKARILQKAPPQYTEAARSVRVTGTVAVCGVLSADGRVDHLLVLQGLPFGLNGSATDAARQITFNAAVKDGRAVPTFTHVEFNFNLY